VGAAGDEAVGQREGGVHQGVEVHRAERLEVREADVAGAQEYEPAQEEDSHLPRPAPAQAQGDAEEEREGQEEDELEDR
jgi:hypothetical protein